MNEITKTQQRTRSYWYSDGIAEIVGGVAFVLIGLPLYAAARTGIEMLSTLPLISMILLFPLSARVVRYLKDRITHQRTGYVKYSRPPMSQQRKALIFSILIAISVAIIVISKSNWTLNGMLGKSILLGMGFGIAGTFAVRAWKMQMPRFFIDAATASGLVLVLGFVGAGFVEGVGLLLSVLGVISAEIGMIVLCSYIRRHPKVPVETA